jgi:hypothetical protein
MEVGHKTESDSFRPPAAKLSTIMDKNQQSADSRSQLVQVPIDEVQAIGLKVAPTYEKDDVLSVTLKSFRKVVGYDTFNSILKKDRDEKKDPSDYYNVTVSMMIRRNPETTQTFEVEKFEGNKTLSSIIDKGFPYDDSDIDVFERAKPIRQMTVGSVVGQLNGENITSGSLKNLVTDRTSPVTLAQVSSDSAKADGDVLSALLGENVTRGALKNLVTDKPAPITVALAQTPPSANYIQIKKSDGDVLSALLGENVTRGALKNLVTDKPAPITVALAQTSNPVVNPPFNNWSVNQPSVPHDSGMAGGEDLGLKNLIIDGVNGYDFVQQRASINLENPVVNPPFNNWSVNQPSPPHIKGLNGKEDLGQNIIVDGHRVHFAQQDKPVKLAQIVPISSEQNVPGNFLV